MEAEAVSQITTERVTNFYWRNIIWCFGLPGIIVFDNGTQFTSSSIVEFCRYLGIRNQFISVEHLHANDQEEVANRIILSRMKKILAEAKGLWVEYLHDILWSYHVTPHSTTNETHVQMVYEADAIILVEVNSPTWRRINFEKSINEEGLDNSADLIEEIRRMAHVRECKMKQRMTRRLNTRARAICFQEGDFVLKKVTDTKKGKIYLNWG